MTSHIIKSCNSICMESVPDSSVNLIVTSPPYPMIEMWDEIFCEQNQEIRKNLANGDGKAAFLNMHGILNQVWKECDRVLADNGFICINIGDATRTVNDNFQLYSNHTQIIDCFMKLGYSVLPDILWRKQSNSPNKFMGSGMYPAGAYVTYEHEYILIFRKGGKRLFKGKEKTLRQKSAYFWEERNIWFSDLWDIKGTSQTISSAKKSRERNASFPLQIPYRLINMYSVKGDTVLDPFAGLGTTNIACMISGRNSIGFDKDEKIVSLANENLNQNIDNLNNIIKERIQNHCNFIESLPENKKDKCYKNVPHGFLVKTKQETAIEIDILSKTEKTTDGVICEYKKYN